MLLLRWELLHRCVRQSEESECGREAPSAVHSKFGKKARRRIAAQGKRRDEGAEGMSVEMATVATQCRWRRPRSPPGSDEGGRRKSWH